MTAAATTLQLKVLRFMHAFYLQNDQLPPHHTIAGQFGWKSANAAAEHVYALERHGLLAVNVLGKYKFTEAGRALAKQQSIPI